MESGTSLYQRHCSALSSDYSGVYTLVCELGELQAAVVQGVTAGCDTSTSVAVVLGSVSSVVLPDEAMDHGGQLQTAAANVEYSGDLTIAFGVGELIVTDDGVQNDIFHRIHNDESCNTSSTPPLRAAACVPPRACRRVRAETTTSSVS